MTTAPFFSLFQFKVECCKKEKIRIVFSNTMSGSGNTSKIWREFLMQSQRTEDIFQHINREASLKYKHILIDEMSDG